MHNSVSTRLTHVSSSRQRFPWKRGRTVTVTVHGGAWEPMPSVITVDTVTGENVADEGHGGEQTLGTRISVAWTCVPRVLTSQHSKARTLSARLSCPCGEPSIPTSSGHMAVQGTECQRPGAGQCSTHSLTRLTRRPCVPTAAGPHW